MRLRALTSGMSTSPGEKLLVLGKGSRERIALTLPKNAKDALASWLQWRAGSPADAPLFVNLAHDSPGQSALRRWRLSRHRLPARRARQRHGPASRLAPHCNTAALDAFGGDYRKARAFSRHASLETVRRYDDNRADHAGQVAAVIDGLAA